jgi:hypothetical protein
MTPVLTAKRKTREVSEMVDIAFQEMAKFFWFMVRITVALIVGIVQARKAKSQEDPWNGGV